MPILTARNLFTCYLPTFGACLQITRNNPSFWFARQYKTVYGRNSSGIAAFPKRLKFSTAAKSDYPFKDSQIDNLVEHGGCSAPVLSTDVLIPSSSDFSTLARKGAFVDKSHALQDFLSYWPVDLLLCPRRSGKTTLLRMFREYFEFASPDELARRKELFIKNRLAITQDPRFEKEFGKYPVLYIDFSNVTGLTMTDLLQNFKVHVSEIARRLEAAGWFEDRGRLGEHRQKFLDEILSGTLPDSWWHIALLELTEILHTLHQRRVIVLVDEYDTPTSYAVRHGYFPEAKDFFRHVFLTLLKNNEHLHGALLVGILHVPMTGWFSGVNNISVYRFGETSKYDTACMFTEDETRKLYDRQDQLKKLPFTFDDLRSWYDGYSTSNGVKLFNPWSISNALTMGQLDTWWNKSGYEDATIREHIMRLLKNDDVFRDQCETLLAGSNICIETDPIAHISIQDMSRGQLWTFMYDAGYLANSPRVSLFSGTRFVRIPNSEIRREFHGWIREDLKRRMTPKTRDVSINLFHTMIEGNFAEFAKMLGECIITTLSSRLLSSEEKVYQEYLYFYFSGAAKASERDQPWTIKMERSVGDGRAAIFFYRGDIGIVLKLKNIRYKTQAYGQSEQDQLSNAAKIALAQCNLHNYSQVMPEGVKTVFEYGVAFLGTYCAVEGRVIEKVGGSWTRNGDEYTAQQDEQRRRDMYGRRRRRPRKARVI